MRLRIGYVPLTDAALLVAAAERGFAAAEGLRLELVREPSWATLRDKLALGRLDGAHMLAPLAIASTLGLSGPRAALIAPFALNLNGNAITVSARLWAELADLGAEDEVSSVARAFGKAAAEWRRRGERFRLATVFPFSTHTYQLHAFARLSGVELAEVADVVVVPPPRMAEALRSGDVDGFCVGSPWNSVAVEAGSGRIAALGVEIVPDAPEKILALPSSSASEAVVPPLLRALKEAGRWCADPSNRAELAALLAEPRHLDLDARPILRSLEGRLLLSPDGHKRENPRYIVLGEDAHRPRPAHARWILHRMIETGQATADAEAAAAVYRTDLFDAILGR
jgi:NitT/TauT family transport system ATP-binding protein